MIAIFRLPKAGEIPDGWEGMDIGTGNRKTVC